MITDEMIREYINEQEGKQIADASAPVPVPLWGEDWSIIGLPRRRLRKGRCSGRFVRKVRSLRSATGEW